MRDKDFEYMNIALEIAFSRLGRTSPNPSVGAVIVRDGKIISTGGTSRSGEDHAEAAAIKNARCDLSGADIYITLEPCCHSCKKTPPCTDALIKSNISRVFIPITDPNPEVCGMGIKTLKQAGIDVIIMDEAAQRASDLIRQFKKFIREKKPYIIYKSAVTLDGRTAAESGDSKWISSEYSRYIVHKLRAISDAVIVGKNMFTKDNPSLNVRFGSFPDGVRNYFRDRDVRMMGRDNFFLRMLLQSDEPDSPAAPLRVVAGLPDACDPEMNIFKDDNFIFFADSKKEPDIKRNGLWKGLLDRGKVVLLEGSDEYGRVQQMLKVLYSRDKMFVLLEGGSALAGSFLKAGEIDQFIYFIAPRILGNGPGPVRGGEAESIGDSLALADISAVMVNDDLLYNAYSKSFGD